MAKNGEKKKNFFALNYLFFALWYSIVDNKSMRPQFSQFMTQDCLRDLNVVLYNMLDSLGE